MTERVTITITENSNALGQVLFDAFADFRTTKPETTIADLGCAIAGCLLPLDKGFGEGTAKKLVRMIDATLTVMKQIERENAWSQISDTKQ